MMVGLLDLFDTDNNADQQLDPNSLLGSFGVPGWTNKQARDNFGGGLLNFGAAVLAANQPGVSMGQAIGQGAQAFGASIQAGKQQALQDQMMGMRMDAMRQQQEQAKARQQSIRALTQQYPHLAPLFAVDPGKAADVMAEQLKPRQPKMHVVGNALVGEDGRQVYQAPPKPGENLRSVGNSLVDITTGKPVFTAPQQYGPTEMQRNLQAAGISPSSPEGQAIIKSHLMGSEPLATVASPTGPVMVPRSQAIGKAPYIEPRQEQIPVGYRKSMDGTGLEPIPGGPADPRSVSNTASAADRSKLKQMEVDAASLRGALGDFRAAVGGAGTGDKLASVAGINTEGATKLNTTYNNAALLSKAESLYNLGVLNGPDLDIIRRTITDPSTFRSLGTSREAWNGQIDQIGRLLDQRLTAARQQFGGQVQAEAPAPKADAGAKVSWVMRNGKLVKE